ncbi:hypothetical protein P9J64_00795 [Deltaproteobacteria bacterium IMCC39524]|nr:hypothetical protein [Deltaproteobacteria bacterium IMCC39524]
MLRTFLIMICLILPSLPVFAVEDDAENLLDEQIVTNCALDVSDEVVAIFEEPGLTLEEMLGRALDADSSLCGVLSVAKNKGYSQERVLEILLSGMSGSVDVLVRAAIDAGYDMLVVGEISISSSQQVSVGEARVDGSLGALGGYGSGEPASPASL